MSALAVSPPIVSGFLDRMKHLDSSFTGWRDFPILKSFDSRRQNSEPNLLGADYVPQITRASHQN